MLAKWKGSFTITKVPNRFQIEYLEIGINCTTHISYAKRFYERSLNVRTKRLHHRLSRKQGVIEIAHLRLVTGSGRNRRRMRAFSLAEIYRRWHYLSGPKLVRIQVRGSVEELPEGLRTLVTEAGTSVERGCWTSVDSGLMWRGVVVTACPCKLSVRTSPCHKRMTLLLLLIR